MKMIDVGADFSRYPGGRYRSNGRFSGEEFRDECLLPALADGDAVTIALDSAIGYGSSFLEEAFGGVIRALELSAAELLGKVTLATDDALLEAEIVGYIEAAGREL